MVFWALSALYLCIGSLVHFHQYKIYGKKLVAEVVISKREHEITVQDQDSGPAFQSGSPAILAGEPVHFALPVTRTAATCSDLRPATLWRVDNSGLRAPPQA